MAVQGAPQRRPSIHDVASHAGVSAATVSKVMQGVATVKPANVQRVFDAVERLGYRMDPLASELRRSKRRIIGAVVPEFESEFFGTVITELERLAEQRGYALVAASSRESETREKEILARMHDWRVSGVVLAPVRNERSPAAAFMKASGMTGVMIDRVLADNAFDTISADSAAASAEWRARWSATVTATPGHRHREHAATVHAPWKAFRARRWRWRRTCARRHPVRKRRGAAARLAARLFRQGRAADGRLLAVPEGNAGGAVGIPAARLALPERHLAGRLRRCRMDAGDVSRHRRRGPAGPPHSDAGDGSAFPEDRGRGRAVAGAARTLQGVDARIRRVARRRGASGGRRRAITSLPKSRQAAAPGSTCGVDGQRRRNRCSN